MHRIGGGWLHGGAAWMVKLSPYKGQPVHNIQLRPTLDIYNIYCWIQGWPLYRDSWTIQALPPCKHPPPIRYCASTLSLHTESTDSDGFKHMNTCHRLPIYPPTKTRLGQSTKLIVRGCSYRVHAVSASPVAPKVEFWSWMKANNPYLCRRYLRDGLQICS